MNPALTAIDANRQEPYTGEIPTPEELGYLPPGTVDPTRGSYRMSATVLGLQTQEKLILITKQLTQNNYLKDLRVQP